MRLLALCTAQFVVVLDVTIVAIALPAIGRDLDMGAASLQWVLSAYVLTFGGALLAAGRAADLLGRRRLFAAGMAVFAAASLGCALARSAPMLVALRAVQGLGSAAVAPAALALLTAAHPDGPGRARALSLWTAVAAGGGATGWVLGGVLVSTLGWRAVFWINVPVAVGAVALARATVAESRDHGAPPRLDVMGATLATTGLGALVLGLTRAPDASATSTTLALAVSAALLAAFVVHERRAPHALVPRGTLGAPGLARAVLVALALTAATTPAMFLSLLFVQRDLGVAPARAGLLFAVFNVAVVVASLRGGAVARRRGLRSAMALGLAVIAAGALALLAGRVAPAPLPWIVAGFVLMGGGLGVASVASTAEGTAAGGDRRGLAGGLLNASAQVGTALGLAVLVPIAQAAGPAVAFAGAAVVALAGATSCCPEPAP
jgi:MFS family permease